jgi:uncharacterized protein RhaS with RHS repeats
MRPDPVAASGAVPQSLNRYAYVGNDPVNATDPLGLLACTIDGVWAPCSMAFGLLQSGAGAGVIGPDGPRWNPNGGPQGTGGVGVVSSLCERSTGMDPLGGSASRLHLQLVFVFTW